MDKLTVADMPKLFYTVKVPKIGIVSAETPEYLSELVRERIDEEGYGAREVGGHWLVTHNGKRWGSLSYNGRLWPNQFKL